MASSSSSSPEISAAPCANTPDHSSYKYDSIDEVLDDLSSRFILNLPDEELASLERICFQVEQAHWFYEDFIREENPKFPSLPLKKFSALLFHACPLLHQWSQDHEQAFTHFMQYKIRVPVCGAIMLNDTWDKCILVKGWKSSSGWGFPKGKINQDEEPHKCAVREVLEETGYDLSGQINPEDVIEMSIKEQKISLYIVAGVPEDYPFKTRTRKEISKIEWFRLTDLPTWKRNKAVPGKFYLISPFIGSLRAFINERKPRHLGRRGHKVKNVHTHQDVHVRNEGEGGYLMDMHEHTTISHDRSAQESSSASSADNGDPQTPSPQVAESVVTHVVDSHMATEDPNDVAKLMSVDSMDPHFARLLNSLTLSASSTADRTGEGKASPASLSIKTDAQDLTAAASTTPVPASTSSTHSRAPLEHSERADWSVHEPTPLAERRTGAAQSHERAQGPHQGDGPSLAEISPPKSLQRPHAAALSLSPQVRRATPLSDSSQIPQTPVSATLSTSSYSTSQTSAASCSTSESRPSNSRSSSGTVDISPYLPRATEVPTSGKRLKQLALLESVANESARMTPMLEQQMAITMARARATTGVGQNHGAPGPLPPMPPDAALFSGGRGPTDPRLIYSSNNAQHHSFGNSDVPRAPSTMPFGNVPAPSAFPIDDDPFTVRPRTSNSFRMPPSHHASRGNLRTSMHERQLLSLLQSATPNGLQQSPIHPSQMPLPPSVPPQPLPGMMPHPMHLAMPRAGHPAPAPLQVPPPNMMTPGPLSAPAGPPIFDSFGRPIQRAPGNSAELLSILNTGRVDAGGMPSTGIMSSTSPR